MRYRVRAHLKPGRALALKRAIDDGTLGQGSIAGDEYLRNMAEARLHDDGTAEWVEVCFCRVPLDEERDYWEDYFDVIAIEDAVDRRACKHESGKQPWSCTACTCTRILEQELSRQGAPFYESL